MHTDYSSSSACNTNAQLLDFNAPAWVIDIPVHDMKLAFSNNLHQVQCLLNTIDDTSFDITKSAPFFSWANATLTRCHSSPPTPMVFRNSFDPLSTTHDDEEDNIEALMTFSSLPTTAAPLCQPHLNTLKTSVRNARHSIPSPSHPHHIPSNLLPPLG